MFRTASLILAMLIFGCSSCFAQSQTADFPKSLVIARDTYFDFGPPFHYYDLSKVDTAGDELSVENILVTPEANYCWQPARVEERNSMIHKTMSELLNGKNPCSISDKELHREQKRCKHCLNFSGVNLMMLVNCSGVERQLRMDILDRDLFDKKPNTPEHTSWTMSVLSALDKAIGPGAMEKPAFSLGDEPIATKVPDTDTIRSLRAGKYDDLFGKGSLVSQMVSEAEGTRPPPPSVTLLNASPFSPLHIELPKYPPIAKAARLEGQVIVQFDVDSTGKAENVVVADGPKVLRGSASEAVSKWAFPESAVGRSGQATLAYKLNCQTTVRTNVN